MCFKTSLLCCQRDTRRILFCWQSPCSDFNNWKIETPFRAKPRYCAARNTSAGKCQIYFVLESGVLKTKICHEVERIKSNPAMHLAQNKIGPYFIGKTIVWQKIDWLSQLVDKNYIVCFVPRTQNGKWTSQMHIATPCAKGKQQQLLYSQGKLFLLDARLCKLLCCVRVVRQWPLVA